MLHRKEGCVTTLKMTAKETTFSVDKFFNGLMATTQTLMNMLSESPLDRYSLGLGFGLSFNPFAPELPITALADPASFQRLRHHQF